MSDSSKQPQNIPLVAAVKLYAPGRLHSSRILIQPVIRNLQDTGKNIPQCLILLVDAPQLVTDFYLTGYSDYSGSESELIQRLVELNASVLHSIVGIDIEQDIGCVHLILYLYRDAKLLQSAVLSSLYSLPYGRCSDYELCYRYYSAALCLRINQYTHRMPLIRLHSICNMQLLIYLQQPILQHLSGHVLKELAKHLDQPRIFPYRSPEISAYSANKFSPFLHYSTSSVIYAGTVEK